MFASLGPAPERVSTPLLDPGSPAQASLPIQQLSPKRSPDFYRTAPPEGSLVFRCPACSKTEAFAQNRPMFRGPSWDDLSRVPLRSLSSEEPGSRVALEEDRLIRRLFPAGPEQNPKVPSIACRRRSVLLSVPHPSCRCRPSESDWDIRPDHLKTMHVSSESRK